MKNVPVFVSLALLLSAGAIHAQNAPTGHAMPGATSSENVTTARGEVVYEDATGQTTATITQVLPNATNTQSTTLSAVRRIRIQSDVFIIEWGETATTLLPRQYVAGIALNRRNAAK